MLGNLYVSHGVSFVIHAVGPVYKGGHDREAPLLAACIYQCLLTAHHKGCTSIAIPAVSTGNNAALQLSAASVILSSSIA